MNIDLLNTRQKEVLAYLRDFQYRNGYSPSIRDIAAAIGVRSTSTVHGYLEALEEAGCIWRNPAKKRSIVLCEDEEWRQKELMPIPLVGSVHAGSPVTAEQNIEDVYPFPRQFIGSDEIFMLEVRGDSMINEGILPGDFLFVQTRSYADNGDIVVALVDEEDATVKTYYKEKDHIRLQPGNDNYEPICRKDVKVLGKVVGVYRKYN